MVHGGYEVVIVLPFLRLELPPPRSLRRSADRSDGRSPRRSVSDLSSFARPRSKLACTASSPVAKVMAKSRRSQAVRGFLRPSLWTSALDVVPQVKALITSASLVSSSSLRFHEKRWM